MWAEGANEDGSHHWGDPEGFHINTVNLPHDLALQLKHLFWNPALLLPAFLLSGSCSHDWIFSSKQ